MNALVISQCSCGFNSDTSLKFIVLMTPASKAKESGRVGETIDQRETIDQF